jgi:ribosomal protein S12 methylthiotransferase
MNRKGKGEDYLNLVNKLKTEIPNIAIRSTFITGFPFETEEDFEILVNFIKSAKFFNAGFFKYSKEEGTPAGKMQGQVPAKIKEKRLRKLYSTQKKVVKENYKEIIGKTVKVFAEGFDENELVYFGRAYFNAPDIDGKIYFFSDEEIEYGKTYDVKLLKASDYDFYGERL